MPTRLLIWIGLASLQLRAENWPQFRGPRGDGTSIERITGPLAVRWKTKLPGPGHSSPIVWGDRIFLTAFEPDTSLVGGVLGRRGQLLILALDRQTGAVLWRKRVETAEIEKTTNINQPASPTPATDGKRLFAYFGSYGLMALDFDGTPVWENKIGPFPHHMGTGSSPVLSGDRLLLNVETDGPSFLYALDRLTGRTLWRSPRKTRQAAYASPVSWNGNVVVPGSERLIAYSWTDGSERWGVYGMSTYVVPTPVTGAGLLYTTSSGPGGNMTIALRPDGSVAWRNAKGAAYVASPVLQDGRLYTVNLNCVVSCLDAGRGTLLWQGRLATQGECYASPVAAGNRLYVVASSGEIHAVEAGPKFAAQPIYNLAETTIASPAISGGLLLVRSNRSIVALAP